MCRLAHNALPPAQTVHRFYGPMVTGVTVSKTGRVFANFPRWGDPVKASVVEIKSGLKSGEEEGSQNFAAAS